MRNRVFSILKRQHGQFCLFSVDEDVKGRLLFFLRTTLWEADSLCLGITELERPWNSPGPHCCFKKPQRSMKIERPSFCLSCQLLFFFFLEVHFSIGGFVLFKQYWKEWLDVAKHIWAHLDWIARSYWVTGWAFQSGSTVAMFRTLGFMLLSNNVVSLCIGSGETFQWERPLVREAFGQDKQVDRQR